MQGQLDFAEFYSAAFGPLTSQLHAFVGSHAEAQDLVQEAFCRAFGRWSTISRYDDPQAWVRRVAWNLAVSRWRRTRLVRLWQRDLAPADVPEPTGGDIDLARALAELPPDQRQAIVLHYLADMPVTDVAAFMEAPEGTVKAWLHRGRGALAASLGADAEAARSAAQARTRPPGVAAVRATVTRRYATRATALLVGALALAAGALVPISAGVAPTNPSPGVSPSPASPSPSPTATPSAQPSTQAPSAPTNPARSTSTCPYDTMAATMLLVSPAPDTYAKSAQLQAACPSMRMRVTRATYVGATATAAKLTRHATTSGTLTSQSAVRVATPGRPAGECYARLQVTLAGSASLPASIPNPIPDLVSSGREDSFDYYWASRGLRVLDMSWADPVC
ncbi:SigE family RNA polymerase sigma factor [Catellatospora sp. KI3]|uniref:SigE family RNA polymerase sigma factor n=1 Tax=Catellatospora sp. KI3 TaxID=3041620 RepID=UPI0024824CDE|nr:SigE family RNA polymerase sigma factor [Catellatospora sp. KI3]MDI1464296.1 SigE family RNA polymerase sigma factor [Catellatospora sp. KI3]